MQHFPAREKSVDEKAMQHYLCQCCKSRCSWNVSLDKCIEAHRFFAHMSQLESRRWLKDRLVASSVVRDGHRLCSLLFGNNSVCNQGFKLLYGISNNKFAQALKDADFPYTLPTHGNLGHFNRESITVQEHIYTWIGNFIAACGDQDPSTDHIHFPCYISGHSMYEMYEHDCSIHNMELETVPSESAFFAVLNNRFPNVRFLKKTRLGRCDFCLSIPLRRKQISTEADRNAFQIACQQHHDIYLIYVTFIYFFYHIV